MAQEQHFLQVRPGPQPLPFFAEYPYFTWGEVNYESAGDCQRPTDRAWSWLTLTRRDSGETLEIARVSPEGERPLFEIKGEASEPVWAAAYLSALRSSGSVLNPPSLNPIRPDDLAPRLNGLHFRLAAADRVQAMFGSGALAPFDAMAWWGGWKWSGEFASETAHPLRCTLKAVEDGAASPELLDWLWNWWKTPPLAEYYEGVRYALYVLTGIDPASG